jgi:hypothetical protein
LDEELPAHAEVGQEGVGVVQRQPEVLAAAAHPGHDPARGGGCEVRRSGQVPADRARVEDLDGVDAVTHDVLRQTSAYDLDLGQLGHVRT